MGSPKKRRTQQVAYSVADSFETLCRIQEQALSAEPKPDFATALKIEELKGKLTGLYVDPKSGAAPDIPQILVEFANDGQDGSNTGGVQTADDDKETD